MKRFLLCLLLAGCTGGDSADVRRTFYADGTPWSEIVYLHGLPHGTWKTWYPDGTLKSQGTYHLGKQSGEWLTYDEHGQLLVRAQYEDDRPNGLWEAFWEDGSPKHRGRFEDGVRTGVWSEWYQNGQMSSEGPYENGEREGYWKMWFPDGRLGGEGDLHEGLPEGPQMIRAENGIVRTGEMVKGKEQGPWIFWHPGYPEVKKKAGEVSYVDGAFHGEHVQWDEDGNVISVGEWDHGVPVD